MIRDAKMRDTRRVIYSSKLVSHYFETIEVRKGGLPPLPGRLENRGADRMIYTRSRLALAETQESGGKPPFPTSIVSK